MNQKFKKYFPPLIGILAVFAVWYIVCRAGLLSSYVLPSPGRVFQSFCKMLQSGELFRDLRISFVRVGKGFVIAFVLAFAFGMLRAMVPASAGYYEYLVQCKYRNYKVHTTENIELGIEIGLTIDPYDIQVMHKMEN